jgi:hypothetical protein
MFMRVTAAALAGGIAIAMSAASAGTLVPIPMIENGAAMAVSAINNHGVLAGTYIDKNDGNAHGFFGPFGGPYTIVDFPNTGRTFLTSIADNGTVAGQTDSTRADCPMDACQYLRKPNGTFVQITLNREPADGYPGQLAPNSKFTGEIWWQDQDLNILIAGYLGKSGKYKSQIDLPFDTKHRVRPRGLNKHGMVTGYYEIPNEKYDGFVIKDGVATSTEFPDANAYYTRLQGSNAMGQIAGYWSNSNSSSGQAFLYDLDSDSFDTIAVPGEAYALARQINDQGVVVIIGNTSGTSYLYCLRKRSCPSSPGAIEIKDRWVKARHDGRRWAVCRNGCLKAVTVMPPKASPAAIDEAMKRDPTLARERFGLD